jgi:aldehyde:ferredoxin oxidoreductase
VSAKSPLTGFLGDSNAGGFWASELKFAGYDNIVLFGRAQKPVYLWIEDDHVEMRDATHLWGNTTSETDRILKEQHGDPRLQVACIGPAGEKLVRFACIVNNLVRTAARTGMGAVMGSKNLKAIAVRGTKGVKVKDPEKFLSLCKRVRAMILQCRQFQLYHKGGVFGYLENREEKFLNNFFLSFLTPNYQSSSKIKVEKIGDGKQWWDTHWVSYKACYGCHMHCSHFYIVKNGPFIGTMVEGPEAEAAGWVGPHVGNWELDLIAYAYTLEEKFGIDACEMGAILGWLMLCYEKGVLTDQDLKMLKAGWLRPTWGDPETILTIIEKVAKREGIGDLLAEGLYRAAKKIGKEAEYYALVNKRMSTGGGDRRVQIGGLLNHMVSTRGPDHLRGSPSLEFYGYVSDNTIKKDWAKYIAEPELFESATKVAEYRGKAPLVIFQEHLRALSDSFGVCSFNYGNWPNTPFTPEHFAELYSMATGIEWTWQDCANAAERILNIEKAFNVREGWDRSDDQPPERWVKEGKIGGPFQGNKVDLDQFHKMLAEYYERRGWNKQTGLQIRGRLEKLGLNDVAAQLEQMGKLAH